MKYFKDQYRELCPGVYVWNNFLSSEELKVISDELDSKNWGDSYQVFDLKSFSQYKERILNSLNMPNAKLPDLNNCIKRPVGHGMPPHVDIQHYANIFYDNEIDKDSELEKDVFIQARFGFIIYFNDNYEGGEICYPEYDFCYSPKAGDIVFHDVKNIHAVKKVLSGCRYTHSSYLSDDFYLPKELSESINWPNVDFTLDDPRFHYSVVHGKSDNKRLAKFMETYINDRTYAN